MRVRTGSRGFAYTEVLVAAALLAILIAPALESLANGMQQQAYQVDNAVRRWHLAAALETTLALPMSNLDALAGDSGTPSDLSDAAGSAVRRLVYVSRYDVANGDGDGDPFTGGDGTLLWVAVALENSPLRLEALVAP